MKSIRSKLLIFFFIFIILFQVVSISIFISSKKLSKGYEDSFQRFLLLNTLSQLTEELSSQTKIIATDYDTTDMDKYFSLIQETKENQEKLFTLFNENDYQIKNYYNLIGTFILESKMTVGFVLRDDIEQYADHIDETIHAAGYIQEYTLDLVDSELTTYQAFYDNMQQRNHYFLYFIIFLFITSISLAIFFVLWFSTGITKPIKKLASAATEVSEGKLSGKPVHIKTKDELQLLGQTFNDMRSNISHLVQEIKEQSELDLLLQEMELKHLQNQINPHFLFNTLNTVSKMAYLEDAHETTELINSIAALFRYSLGDINRSVSLVEEVDVIKDYFLIQKHRFSDRVNISYNIDENCLHTRVPRLTLQPLIENSFIHGIEDKEEGGTIILNIKQVNDYVIIEIIDNGIGIDEKRLKQIQTYNDKEHESVGHSTGIGLANVTRRLQLYYKTDNLISIESELGEGTRVKLVLPKKQSLLSSTS